MHDSRLLSWFCASSAFLSDFNAASTSANSFTSVSSSQAILLECTIFETKDQLLGFDFGPEMKDRTDSKIVKETASTSLSLLTMAIVSWSLLREEIFFPFRLIDLDCFFHHLPGV